MEQNKSISPKTDNNLKGFFNELGLNWTGQYKDAFENKFHYLFCGQDLSTEPKPLIFKFKDNHYTTDIKTGEKQQQAISISTFGLLGGKPAPKYLYDISAYIDNRQDGYYYISMYLYKNSFIFFGVDQQQLEKSVEHKFRGEKKQSKVDVAYRENVNLKLDNLFELYLKLPTEFREQQF